MSKNFIIMGVSGCGKSTVGELLSVALQVPFFDGDDYHPDANVAKMKNGIALNDRDRTPWLEKLATLMNNESPCVIACSALKQSYRNILRTNSPTFVFLSGSKELLLDRLNQRSANTDHFMPSSLLDSQLNTLENPEHEEDTITFDISLDPKIIIRKILSTQC